MANPRRVEKIQRQILRTVSQTVLFDLKDPRTVKPITITRVKLSRDLSVAKVFYSVLGDETDRRTAQRFLEHATAHVRRAIADDLTTRIVPEVEFHFDPAIEGSIAISEALNEVADELRAKGELLDDDDETGATGDETGDDDFFDDAADVGENAGDGRVPTDEN